MFLKKVNDFITNDKFLYILLFIVALLINQHYASRGIFPIDGFAHFDSGFRILNGEYPIKDFWIVSGLFVDYLEALFFYLLGVSWKTHVIHSSLINGIITLATYFVLRSVQFKKIYSFLYSLFFGILAYPPSGTPFVDHHATFLSLLGIYCFILALNSKGPQKKYLNSISSFDFILCSQFIISINIYKNIITYSAAVVNRMTLKKL